MEEIKLNLSCKVLYRMRQAKQFYLDVVKTSSKPLNIPHHHLSQSSAVWQ